MVHNTIIIRHHHHHLHELINKDNTDFSEGS